MLGRDLTEVLCSPGMGHEVIGLDLPGCDITDRQSVRRFTGDARPDAVIHCAAYTDVDGCERNPDRAMLVNGEGTRHVAEAARIAGARLVAISTDYVFDGAKRAPYLEDDPPNPRSAYGRSKLAAERAALEQPNSLVVRTAWLYGRHGRHFVGAILERARRGEPLRVVADQVGSPTWSRHLARALAALAAGHATGIVHATGSGQCSWHEFASAIVEEAAARGLAEAVPVAPITSAQFDRPAPRPAYSVLSNARLKELGVVPLPHWRDALREFLTEAC